MITYCWDGRTLATDAQELAVVIDGQLVTFVSGTVGAVGPLSAAALGALSCGATAARALEAGQQVAAAFTPAIPPVSEPPDLKEVGS